MHSIVKTSSQNLAWLLPVGSVKDWNIISVNDSLEMDNARSNELPLLVI
jgi:hypothetical protein